MRIPVRVTGVRLGGSGSIRSAICEDVAIRLAVASLSATLLVSCAQTDQGPGQSVSQPPLPTATSRLSAKNEATPFRDITASPSPIPTPLAVGNEPQLALPVPSSPSPAVPGPTPTGLASPTPGPTATTTPPTPVADASRPKIKFLRGDFDPLVGRSSLPSPDVLWLPENTPGQRYYVIQFESPPAETVKSLVASAGASLLEYLPESAYIARVDQARLSEVRRVPGVRWVGLFQPAFKVSPRLDPLLTKEDPVAISVRLFPGEDADSVISAAKRIGTSVQGGSPSSEPGRRVFRLTIKGSQIPELAKITGIAWIEQTDEPQLN